jgi:hypothetical protein
MLNEILVGAAVSISNIAIHALVMTVVVRVARQTAATTTIASPSLFLAGVMVGTVSVFMAAHTVEVLVWALAYSMVGAAPEGTNLVYFAFVNYTTLGYGDVVPVKEWEVLGPLTAMNGVLMFGWSTAVMFEVLRRSMALDSRDKPAG